MMGSRGSGNTEAIALGTLLEIREWIKNADTSIPAAITEFRKLSGEIAEAQEKLKTAAARDAERVADLHRQAHDIDEAHQILANRERAAAAKDATNAARDAEFAQRERVLGAGMAALAEAQKATATRRADVEREISQATAALDLKRQETESIIHHRMTEHAAMLAAEREACDTELAQLRAAATKEVDNRLAEVIRREAAVVGREAATRKHAAELAALAQE